MAMFNGRNVFLGYINGKDILLDKLIYRYDPSIISFGESLSQTSYDLITPESNKYYAISSEFEQISELYNVYNLSQEEYEELSTYDKNSLYIISIDSFVAVHNNVELLLFNLKSLSSI